MQLNLGTHIRALRRGQGRTQEALAEALGVTSQAVSRWESGGSYPDMELMPAIANYFGVTIDQLFGYHGDREQKVASLLAEVDTLYPENAYEDVNFDRCIALLRQGLAEFPGNEKLTHRLAVILTDIGWKRHRQWLHYGEDGHIQNCFDHHRENEYWNEATKLFEKLLEDSADPALKNDCIYHLVMLYRNVGDYASAIRLGEQLPRLCHSREIMLANGTDGVMQAGYLGSALLELAYQFAEQMMYALVNNKANYETDLPIAKVQGAIALFDLLADGGCIGVYHREVAYLYLYLSRLQWEYGQKDEAFDSLDLALEQARMYDRFSAEEEPCYTSPLLKHANCKTEIFSPKPLAEGLPASWPMWCNPDYSAVEKEIKADPRWEAWVAKTMHADA